VNEHADVDPANGTLPHVEDSGPTEPPPRDPGPGEVHRDGGPDADGFTAPEKITSVVRAVLARPSDDPKVAALLAAITSPIGRRWLVAPMLALLPPLDEPDEWDEWLAVLAGCALELTSDEAVVDVGEARGAARYMLQLLFEGAPG
jgi:hypothetical protein